MIADKRVLAIVPARAGSKRLPGKNIKPLNGKKLIHYTLEAAEKSRYIDEVVLSSEDPVTLSESKNFPKVTADRRPDVLAADTATTAQVIEDILLRWQAKNKPVDIVVLLQPTSPLRTAADIDGALEMSAAAGWNSCVSVTRFLKSPLWMYSIDEGQCLQPLLKGPATPSKSQEFYILNGAVYVARREDFLEYKTFVTDSTLSFVMPSERSVDIDYDLDFTLAEILTQRGCNEPIL